MAEQEIQATVQGEPLPGRPLPRLPEGVSPQDEGGGIGQGLENVGAVVEQAQLHADRTRALAADNDRATWVNQTLYDPQNGLMRKQGANAVNLQPQFTAAYDKQNEAQAATLANGRQREMFMQQAAHDKPLIEAQLMRHEGEQADAYADQTAGARISTAQQTAALNFNDPQITAKSLSDIDLALQASTQRKGWSPEELQVQQQAHFSQLHMGVIGAMLDHDRLPEAQSYLEKVRSVLDPAQAEKADGWISTGQVTAASKVISAAYARDPTAGAAALAALQHSKLDTDQQLAVFKQVEAGRAMLSVERRQQYQKPLMALEEAIDSDHPPADAKDQVLDLWHKGVYTDDQAASAMGRIDRINEKGNKDKDGLKIVSDAFQNRTPLDPQDKDIKGDVDRGFLAMTMGVGVKPGTPEYTNRAVSWAERTGVVPESFTSWARANLVSGDPKVAAQAADGVSKIRETNPRALEFGLDPKTTAIAALINSATAAGTDPMKAVEVARANADLGDADRAVLDQRWSEKVGQGAKADLSQSNALQAHLSADPNFKSARSYGGLVSGSIPAVPPAMQGDFDALTKEYYRYSKGDINQARDLAARDLKHVWGVSEVNGARQIMPYAPEAMFPGLTPDVVRNDIAKTVTDNAAAFPAKLDASKVQLVPDPRETARTNGRVWNLGAPDEFGARDIVRDANGHPLVYQLPVTHEDYGAAKARIGAQRIAEARALKASYEAQASSIGPGKKPDSGPSWMMH